MKDLVRIEGPVLLLIGPLGLFFSRVAEYLEKHGCKVYKLCIPMLEIGFSRRQRIDFDGQADEFRLFLEKTIERHGIKHIMMYGDYIPLHQAAIEVCRERADVTTTIFELGYLRPGWITVESDGVNSRSALMSYSGYSRPENYGTLNNEGRMRTTINRSYCLRGMKALTYIAHAMTSYQLMDYKHKLQPKPIDIWHQYLGIISIPWYWFREVKDRRSIRSSSSFFVVALQVSTDSQLKDELFFNSMESLVSEICKSASRSCINRNIKIVFKHHPRDRGFNNYRKHIHREARRYGLDAQIHYVHDMSIGELFSLKGIKGLITVNSTVGIEAVRKGIATKALGTALYSKMNITHQGPLDTFWEDPGMPEKENVECFVNKLIDKTQVRGNFDGDIDLGNVFMFNLKSEPAI